jgi:hypothetical protein
MGGVAVFCTSKVGAVFLIFGAIDEVDGCVALSWKEEL